MYQELKKKIVQKKAKIAVIGLGYVGLPLAISFAKKGFAVTGIDTDFDRVKSLKNGKSYIMDVPSGDLKYLQKNGNLKATTDFRFLKEKDIVLICVPTPLKRKYSPDISFILRAVKAIHKFHRKGALIILESTTYPGTTQELILPILESGGRRCEKDFYLGFSPERLDPGNKIYNLEKIPKIISGITKQCAELIGLLYDQIVKNVVFVSSCNVAETVKLLENTFRIVNIGLINEMAMMCHKLNVDIWEVIEAAKTKPFGFMPFYPGPGVGGHCIPKDPLYLYWKAQRLGFPLKFIKLASDINSSMPNYIVSRLKQILKNRNETLTKSKILILGVTYKNDVKDLRKSPSLDIIDLLLKLKVSVSYYDPYIPYLKVHSINLKSIDLNKYNLSKFDCVLVATAHRCLDYNFILNNSRLIFDIRNVFKKNSKNLIKL